MAPTPTPFEQLIRVLTGNHPVTNINRRVIPLVYESGINAGELLEAAYKSIAWVPAIIDQLLPFAGHPELRSFRLELEDTIDIIADINLADLRGEWEPWMERSIQDAIVMAVLQRKDGCDLVEYLQEVGEDWTSEEDEEVMVEGGGDEMEEGGEEESDSLFV